MPILPFCFLVTIGEHKVGLSIDLNYTTSLHSLQLQSNQMGTVWSVCTWYGLASCLKATSCVFKHVFHSSRCFPSSHSDSYSPQWWDFRLWPHIIYTMSTNRFSLSLPCMSKHLRQFLLYTGLKGSGILGINTWNYFEINNSSTNKFTLESRLG